MSEPAAESDPVVAAGDRIRETAKWLTVTIGALGTVLLAGSQLSDIGSLPVGDRLWIALAGATAAVIAAGVILHFAVRTATVPILSLYELKEASFEKRIRPAGRSFLTDADLFAEEATLQAFVNKYYRAVHKRGAEYKRFQAGSINADEFAEINDDYARLNGTARNLVKLAAYEVLAKRWKDAFIAIIAFGAVGTVGITVFAWAANPPAAATASTATPAVLSAVVEVDLRLSEAGQESLSQRLGGDCDVDANIAALRLGTTSAGVDLLIDQEDCQPLRFILVPEWGSVL